jgi:hypothetical protein
VKRRRKTIRRKETDTVSLPDPEPDWGGRPRRGRVFRNWVAVVMALALAGLGWGLYRYPEWLGKVAGDEPRERLEPVLADAELLDEATVHAKLAEAGEVARVFVEAEQVEERLALVRDPEEVRERVGRYAEEARSGAGRIERELGYAKRAGRETAAFVVVLPGESYRHLELVKEDGEWKVDWDAYARFCTASWEDLLSGAVEPAEVRVFASPGDYPVPPFADPAEWTCFQLTSPDLPHRVFGYARAGSEMEGKLREVVLSAPQFRQHVTLEIAGQEGLKGERLFEITKLVAVGWVVGE